ncbi:MAG: HlyD family efflux transporter periplasmic adaptor subunit [Anaerolineae bacterium]|jgi:HlyD family secretion protein
MKHPSKTVCLIILAIGVLFVASCQEKTTPAPEPTAPTDLVSQATIIQGGRVTALGTILPAQQLKLGFLVGGPVLANNVHVGSEVEAGELLAALDTTDLKIAVQEAEDALAVNQALLAQAQAGPQEETVAVALAQVQQAQDQHAQAQAQHEHQQALYQRELDEIYPEEVASAQAEYRAALARYEQVKAGASTEELAIAEIQVQKAEIALQRAQAAYDRVAGRSDVGARPEAAALQEATVDCQAAKAEYERLRNLPTQAALQEARAQLDQAEARLRLAQVEPQSLEEEPSDSGVVVAQAQLDLARSSPRPEDVAVAETQVQQARTALAQAQQALSRAQLTAPFDGTVSAVYLQPAEWAAAGAPVVELLDTGRWRVETRNIGELSIGRVEVDQDAIVRVMAFRSEELRGRVVAISPVAVVQQGDTTYTIMIELDATELNLRPGMNAEVEILTE